MRGLIKLYFWVENIWFRFPEKIRFLLVGGFNTVLAYSLLNALDWLFGRINEAYALGASPEVVANIALIIQYIITINISVVTMRYYVFHSTGRHRTPYKRNRSIKC
jgi:putative flippase GtrA